MLCELRDMQSDFEKTDLELDKLGSQIVPRWDITRELISEYRKLCLDASIGVYGALGASG